MLNPLSSSTEATNKKRLKTITKDNMFNIISDQMTNSVNASKILKTNINKTNEKINKFTKKSKKFQKQSSLKDILSSTMIIEKRIEMKNKIQEEKELVFSNIKKLNLITVKMAYSRTKLYNEEFKIVNKKTNEKLKDEKIRARMSFNSKQIIYHLNAINKNKKKSTK